MNTIFRQEIGYVCDLLYIFNLYFNGETNINPNLSPEQVEENKKHISQIQSKFSPISEDLHIFFALKPNGRSFIPFCYFSEYLDASCSQYDFDFLLQELMNHERFIERLIVFYFPELEGVVQEYKSSLVKMSSVIDSSEYDELIKRELYSFFINPTASIQKLIYDFMAKDVILSDYYRQNYRIILEMQNKLISPDSLVMNICSILHIDCKTMPETLYWSSCLLNKYCIWAHGEYTINTLILGYEYEIPISHVSELEQIPELHELGEVFSEKNRIEILKFIQEHKEVTTKDLERHLSFSGSTAYYHLTLMLRYNVITVRNHGRWMLYKINTKYFEAVIKELNKFIL